MAQGDSGVSLSYILLYFIRGSLPWQDLPAFSDVEKEQLIKEKKESISGEMLCDGGIPAEFGTFINYTRSLGFGDKPDYSCLHTLFRRLFTSKGFKYDNVFDWTEKRFNELHAPAKPLTTKDRQRGERKGAGVADAGARGPSKRAPGKRVFRRNSRRRNQGNGGNQE
ncbi:hypothetical protein N0V88_007068 [Collariella sp. IMI 366227]|nr:hypothetical protein N0V88_007068 [Collariella sp. IMI 366227]